MEEILDSKGNNMPGGYIMINQAVLFYLEDNGGCSSCISLLKRATQS
jgi:hypothetical protein